jgi:hypothetical protein
MLLCDVAASLFEMRTLEHEYFAFGLLGSDKLCCNDVDNRLADPEAEEYLLRKSVASLATEQQDRRQRSSTCASECNHMPFR